MKYARAYLDNATTSWPKPPGVYDACDNFARNLGASAARGAHHEAVQANQIVDQTRLKLRQLLGAGHEDLVVFCLNGTDALNLCIQGTVQEGDHVVATVADHNSVLRPLRELEKTKSVVVDLAECDQWGNITTAQIERFLLPSTRLVVLPHASNVTGTIQPIQEIGELVRDSNALFLIDAAQTAGHVPIDLLKIHADMIATSGHKGLLGPLGTGVAVIRHEFVPSLASFRQGGTGTESENDVQPTRSEEKYESGSLNMLGVAGLNAALDYLRDHTTQLTQNKQHLTQLLLDGLAEIPSVTVYGRPSVENRVAVVSFNFDGLDCHELEMLLESQAHIQVRAGLHCAPRMHAALGTASRGGTVRVSLGPFNTDEHVDRLLGTLKTLAAVKSSGSR